MSKQTEITGGKKSFFSSFKKNVVRRIPLFIIYILKYFLDCVCVLFFSSISSDELGNRNRILVYTRKISRKMDLSQVEKFLQLVLKSFLQGTSETRSITIIQK